MEEAADRPDSRLVPFHSLWRQADPRKALMTRRISLLATISALVLVAPGAGQAAKPGGKPGPSSVTIAAAPNPILFGNSVAISAKLTASTPAGVSVTLKAA